MNIISNTCNTFLFLGDSTKMAGGRHRPVRSLYQAGEEAEGSDARRRRNPRSRRPPARLQVSEEAEPVTPVERAHEEEEQEEEEVS